MNSKKTAFYNTDKKISKLGFGAWGLSGIFEQCSEKELIHSVRNCLDQGITLIDTARDYGDSERILGKALREYTGRQPLISSKIQSKGPGMLRWGMPRNINEVFPKGWITKSAEESLRQLGKEKIDLFQLHLYWANWGVQGYWMDELQELKASGKVDHIGISIPDHRHENALIMVNSGLIDSVQTIVNIFDPYAFDSLIPLCQEKDIAVLARCVLDQGGLTGFLTSGMEFKQGDLRKVLFPPEIREEYIARVNSLQQYIPTYASSLTALSMKFVLAHPGVTSALISMHIEKYANQNIAIMQEDPLPEEIFQEIRMQHRWLKNLFSKVYWSNGIYEEK
ncbi:aldo/keto reductase [Salegentibacter mishustinae]|uniref:aldo/keto reductase n=1 Tax=Salegentibacter mishustinae TaxID=270918 RepID=UPI001CE1465A|nr:aldo/keto reductase [Salegentibacter mishustinae]UBZ05596.1 aldo/keto reductase [Salegentibacter mishustinae]